MVVKLTLKARDAPVPVEHPVPPVYANDGHNATALRREGVDFLCPGVEPVLVSNDAKRCDLLGGCVLLAGEDGFCKGPLERP